MLDSRTSRLLIPALLLAIAGCSPLSAPATAHRTTHLSRRTHAPASQRPTDSAAGAIVPVQSEPLPEVAASATPPAIASAPIHVVGLPQAEVRQLLGPPTTSSTKGAAKSWTYQRNTCSVEIAFYYDVTRNGFFALSQRLASGGDEQHCLLKIHDDHVS
jgi:hypothetical protein